MPWTIVTFQTPEEAVTAAMVARVEQGLDCAVEVDGILLFCVPPRFITEDTLPQIVRQAEVTLVGVEELV